IDEETHQGNKRHDGGGYARPTPDEQVHGACHEYERDPWQHSPKEAIGWEGPDGEDREVADQRKADRRAPAAEPKAVKADRDCENFDNDRRLAEPAERDGDQRARQIERARAERAESRLPQNLAVRPVV